MKSTSDTICSRWNVSPEKMTEENILYLLNNNKGVVRNKAKKFYARYSWLDYDEVYSVALEGFYRAILAYKSEKGNLINYAECYCWGWLRTYFKKNKRYERDEIALTENIIYDYVIPNEDILFLKSIQNKLNKKELELIERFSYGVSIKDSIKYFKFRNRHEYKKELEKTLNKIKLWT